MTERARELRFEFRRAFWIFLGILTLGATAGTVMIMIITGVVNDLIDEVEPHAIHGVQAYGRVESIALLGGTVLVVLVSLLVVFAVVLGRRTSRYVVTPLEDLRDTLGRLADGDLNARAGIAGPAETQALGRAVNELAEASERSQQMQSEALARMKELDEARADFVSSVSHELRTPLTSVTGYAEMLLDGDAGELGEEQAKMVTTIDRNARRLLALVEDILTVARLEVGELRMASEPVDISALVDTAVEAVQPSVAAASLVLDVDAPQVVGNILGDRNQLERVLLNLLSNAVKFTPKGGRVSVTAARENGGVKLLISDTGVGIPIAEQPRMFERFFRSSTSRDAVIPGTGLGLSIVKSIVEAHGGTIDFHSAVGRGTTFTVRLPERGLQAANGQTVDA